MVQQTDLPNEQHDLRIMVIEDNVLIAETICDMVTACGCAVVGPVPDIGQGLELLEAGAPDGVLLDVNLGGTLSFPLAAALEARGVPFVFTTGYDADTVFPPEFRRIRRISKPFDRNEIA